MQLLFISNLFPDQSTRYRGLDNAVLLSYLAAHCESICVIALRPTLNPRLLVLDPLTQNHWQPRPEDAALNPLFVPVPYLPKIGGICNDGLIRHRLAPYFRDRRVREMAFDTVLASWLFPDGCAVAGLAAAQGVPSLLIAQGSDVHQYLGMPVRRTKILRALQQSQGLVTRSARLSTLCEEAGADPAKLHPVYNGVDLQLFHPAPDPARIREELNLPTTAPLVLFVGNFLEVKNPLALIEAFSQVQLPEAPHLVLIGSGPLQGAMEEAASKLAIHPRLHFVGRKEPVQVANYMQAADCLALSSHNEGVPNVILESFAAGLPIVSTNVGGIHEVWPGEELRPVAELVQPGKVADFSAALQCVLLQRGNTALRAALSQHGARFSWEKTAQQYAAVLQSGRE